MKGKRRYGRRVLWTLALALLSVCTGCGGISGDKTLKWTNVQAGAEIDTLNVVLAIDTSSSTRRNDQDSNGLEAACMFLNTLYASASEDGPERLSGSKHVNVGVLLYNNALKPIEDTLASLEKKSTVDSLKWEIRHAQIPQESGDDALSETLDKAVDMLFNYSQGHEKLNERNIILLFTDGYTPLNSTEPLAPEQNAQSHATNAARPVSIPVFGDSHYPQLQSALERAKRNKYSVVVLMMNPTNSPKGGWEKFMDIANYTERNLVEELQQVMFRQPDASRVLMMEKDNFTWPENYQLHQPALLSDPMNNPIFPNPDNPQDKVNYLMAKSPTDLMSFYATLSTNMLSGTSAFECRHGVEDVREITKGNDAVQKKKYTYDIKVPNSGVSALMCFCFSKDGIDAIYLEGPVHGKPDERMDYTPLLRNQDENGWIKSDNMSMRNDWYPHTNAAGEKQSNIVTLTIFDPEPGDWTISVRGKDDKNESLRTYASLVNGTKTNIAFAQGVDPDDENHPITAGDFTVQICRNNDEPLPEDFYATLKTKCEALRIPPWVPIYTEEDVKNLMEDFPGWFERALTDFQKPDPFLTEMSGGEIQFYLDKDSFQRPILKGHFDAPLPGVYYLTLNMTAGSGNSQIDYSRSFWVWYAPKTDRQVVIRNWPFLGKRNQEAYLSAPYLPEAWTRTANTPDAVYLALRIEPESWTIVPSEDTPPDFATVNLDSQDPQTLVIHSRKKGRGTLSFDVSTEYGDKWTLKYDVIVR